MKRVIDAALALLDGFCLLVAWPLFVMALLTAPSWFGPLFHWILK